MKSYPFVSPTFTVKNKKHKLEEEDFLKKIKSCATDDIIETLLLHASKNSYLRGVKCLIGIGANINAKDDQHWTPLHHASQYGHLECVKYLADIGADINAKHDKNWTTVHL